MFQQTFVTRRIDYEASIRYHIWTRLICTFRDSRETDSENKMFEFVP